MGADMWLDCPVCGMPNCVRIDLIYDMDLTKDGKIIHTAKGYCIRCKKEFK